MEILGHEEINIEMFENSNLELKIFREFDYLCIRGKYEYLKIKVWR